MSLRIWLPLIRDTLNYGLEIGDITITNVTSNANGKIGACYSFNGSSSSLIGTQSTISNNTNEWSFACWLKLNTTTAGQTLFSCRTGVNQNGFTIIYYGTTWIIDDGARWQPSASLSTNTWYHICVVYQRGIGKFLYINGVLDKSTTTTGTPTTVSTTNYSVGASQNTSTTVSGNRLNGYLNDVRFYDHAISMAEIHELAKGLVCHYKLDEPLAIENLIRNSSYVVYNNYANSGCTATLVDTGNRYDNCKIYRLTYTPDSSHLSNVQTSLANHGIYGFRRTFSANTKYCFWILWRPISHPDTVCGGTASNISGWTEIPTSKYNDEWNIVGQCRKGNVTTDKTDNIFTSFKTPSATAGTPIVIEFCCPHLVSGYDYILPEYDYIGTEPAVCDSSGYGYHGIKNGGINVTSNTARYDLSTSFDGDVSSIKIPFNAMLGITTASKVDYTVSVWTYKTVIGTKAYQTILGGPSGFELEARNQSSTTSAYRIHNWGGGTAAYDLNKWNLFTFVHTASDSKLYVNGELKVTGTAANVPVGNFFVGAWRDTNSQNYDGLMSDFRVYATALSADDILALYNVGAKVANTGAMMGYQMKEG